MISFKDFLASQEERLRAERIKQDQAREDWVQSVVHLIEQIKQWIKQSDPHGLVRLDHVFGESNSTPANVYVNARLDIHLGDRYTTIRPVAIDVLGPRWKPGKGDRAGEVDMWGEPYAYELYRFLHADQHDQWYLRSTRDWQMKELNQANFDAALIDLFSS